MGAGRGDCQAVTRRNCGIQAVNQLYLKKFLLIPLQPIAPDAAASAFSRVCIYAYSNDRRGPSIPDQIEFSGRLRPTTPHHVV
jgi:hypothetical protein